jgi:hypothetical protein
MIEVRMWDEMAVGIEECGALKVDEAHVRLDADALVNCLSSSKKLD